MSKRARQAKKKEAEERPTLKSQQRDPKSLPDCKAKPAAEWVAEIPIDARDQEEVDACGRYMSKVCRLSAAIKDPDLNLWAEVSYRPVILAAPTRFCPLYTLSFARGFVMI